MLLCIALCASLLLSPVTNPKPTPTISSLWDVPGQLKEIPSEGTIASWRNELHSNTTSSRASQLHVWLAECALSLDEDPKAAHWHLSQVRSANEKTSEAYVEFDVPKSSLKPGGRWDWKKIVGPDSERYTELARRRGEPAPELPAATNIVHKATRFRNP
jgi:hypothetical protein